MEESRPHTLQPERSPARLSGWPFAIMLGLAICLATSDSSAQSRYVMINGVPMSSQQIMMLDSLAGTTVPNGNYWLNLNNGVWGYAGNPVPQGRLGTPRSSGANPAGHNHRGPFGDYMSDGNCSFVNGIPVGNC